MFLKEGAGKVVQAYNSISLIWRIVIGIIIGTILGLLVPGAAWSSLFGDLFVGALKAIAPVLVFVLIVAALVQSSGKFDKRFGLVITLYIISTLAASLMAVIASFICPLDLTNVLVVPEGAEELAPPGDIATVLGNLLTRSVANPVGAIVDANYIGILLWAAIFGLALKHIAADTTKLMLTNISDGVTKVVRWIINLAPFGILGLVFSSVSTSGLEIFTTYGGLVLILVVTMLVVALIISPLIVFCVIRKNPYPLVFRCLKDSGITAFFTRSSAANIPVNMNLCERLGLDRDFYSVSIPLGATINMNGAAVTIAIMTLACAHTMGVQVDIPSALLLCVLSTLGACGASGVAGGSLLLIPMACSLFGISGDIAIQMVGVGFIIGVIQDGLETALNSSGDVIYAATAEFKAWQKEGKPLPEFMG